ncbi:MAG: DUF3604 domain-containing protein [Rhodospirillaceae bacterium]|nr:DUF3604 domain-containing protein [Rhodospirillaceae bacterium]
MRKMKIFGGAVALAILGAAFSAPAVAQNADAVPSNPLKNAYFGELHIHTTLSLDSYIFGNRVDPDAAYRYARGEQITLYGNRAVKLTKPLDFAAITDHAEFMGEQEVCTTPGNKLYDTPMCKGVREMDQVQFTKIADSNTGANGPVNQRQHVPELCGVDTALCVEGSKTVWKRLQTAAAKYYEPGKFSTLLGYEFGPNVANPVNAGMMMLHRNVIFRTAQVPDNPFSAYDGVGEQLHAWLEKTCVQPCRALTIPHNSNSSAGQFFWLGKNSDGTPWTKEILERRARVEPLVEIFQIKGSSECQIGVGLADEECGFEVLNKPCPPGQNMGCSNADSFVQEAVVRGLNVEKEWGVNPFKQGFIGSTDSHNGNPRATEESAFQGFLAVRDSTAQQRLGIKVGVADHDGGGPSGFVRMNPGGLAGVWAEKNTREAIWDALARKETFGTSGTRLRLRVFGGFDFPKDLHKSADLVKIGYEKGVPMGGDLVAAPRGKSPTLVVWAVRDPDSAPLQKIQIVKGWTDKGKEHLKTFDVVCTDGITPDPKTGLCKDNGAGVDTATCKISNDKGAAELAGSWTDPAFNAAERAVYYVRVFENPVCRWSTYEAVQLKLPPPAGIPATIRERAWGSPIWYTPTAGK